MAACIASFAVAPHHVVALDDGAAARAAPSPKPHDLGFVVSRFGYAVYPGMAANCPDGYAYTNSEAYLASLSPVERARLKRPENEKEFETKWKASVRGPNHTNVCTNYDQFPDRPAQKTVQGKISFGLDLDGDGDGNAESTNSYTCPHDSFVGPNGEKGIDNQGYRVMGCMRMWRGPDGEPGEFVKVQQDYINAGDYIHVLLVRGINNLQEDANVEVILASSMDPPVVDAQQHFVTGATFRIIPNARWRNVLHGHIHNGVLTTDPQDIVLRQPLDTGEQGPRSGRNEGIFYKARLQLAFQPDGSLKGILGGYATVLSFIERSTTTGLGAADIVNYDCAAAYNTLKKFADGGRDPKTGQCTTVSTAFEMNAVEAYVVDTPDADAKSASAGHADLTR